VAGAGVHTVAAGAEREFMRQFALADIPFIGPKFQERLERHGLRTVGDALSRDRGSLARALGEREGEWLWERVRGIDDSAVEPWLAPKSISRDETFPEDLDTMDELCRELLPLVDRATADLRAEGLVAHGDGAAEDADFRTRQAAAPCPGRCSRIARSTPWRRSCRALARGCRIPAQPSGGAVGPHAVGAVDQLTLFEVGSASLRPADPPGARADEIGSSSGKALRRGAVD
jgi:nucleotidyltransferase/DNA polymerase involved in DNA repair